jgi:hypothetical protein
VEEQTLADRLTVLKLTTSYKVPYDNDPAIENLKGILGYVNQDKDNFAMLP